MDFRTVQIHNNPIYSMAKVKVTYALFSQVPLLRLEPEKCIKLTTFAAFLLIWDFKNVKMVAFEDNID